VCCSYKGERNKESLLAQAKGIFAFPTASIKFKVFFAYFFSLATAIRFFFVNVNAAS
jgi:hypothetical protein